jgi:hypothetical protein
MAADTYDMASNEEAYTRELLDFELYNLEQSAWPKIKVELDVDLYQMEKT